MRGYRVQAVVRELGGEKIDIIEWSDDIRKMVTSSLSPAKIDRVIVDEEDETVEVIVPDDQLSLAIGRNGQNVRLAARLLGWRIDIHSSSELNKRQMYSEVLWEKMMELLQRLPGVGEVLAEEIVNLGFDSIQSLSEASAEELTSIKGVGPKKAEKIIISAGELAKEIDQKTLNEEIKQEVAKRIAEKALETKVDSIFSEELSSATSAAPETKEGEGLRDGFELYADTDEQAKASEASITVDETTGTPSAEEAESDVIKSEENNDEKKE
jgi:N utilization substance protein A